MNRQETVDILLFIVIYRQKQLFIDLQKQMCCLKKINNLVIFPEVKHMHAGVYTNTQQICKYERKKNLFLSK